MTENTTASSPCRSTRLSSVACAAQCAPTLVCAVLDPVHALTHDIASGLPEHGSNDLVKGEKTFVEYLLPNVAKSVHVGHLRSTITGTFLANLYEAYGWDVVL
ncbi:hypothetical protein DENSPDRAFT_882579 [Dentipellis sp. KUC8613]|nr:hypothetical protein DENSPDRAFT_882579 [Dentipellis sp. KUC8613]